jgi:hypothetical protein
VDPPPLRKGTSAEVQLVPHFDVDGTWVAIALIKQRFLVTHHGVESVDGAEIRLTDELWDPDNPGTSSIKYPSDLCLRKPSTDVVVVGSAMARGRSSMTAIDAGVRVGSFGRALRVYGSRVWYKRAVGALTLSDPQSFEEQPLKWELAWGGSDYESDPKHPIEEPRNPCGRGVTRNPDTLEGQLGPSIEDPLDPVKGHRGSYTPAGVGAIGRSWAPRRNYTGTFDEAWMEERMPLLPLDFDFRFQQVAPPELIAPEPLRGGERVEISNMSERGALVFDLPRKRFGVGLQTDRQWRESPVQLDTVLLEPNLGAFELTWRSVVQLPRRIREIRFVQVHEKEIA